MAKYLGIHPRDWKHSQYKLLCGEISVLQDVKTDGDIATIQAVDWGDEYLALCAGPFSRWSLYCTQPQGLWHPPLGYKGCPE